jgi:hypothetical protein
MYRGSGPSGKLEFYEESPVHQLVTDLAQKVSDMAEKDVKDSRGLATSFIRDNLDRVNYTNDNSSGKTLVSGHTLSQAAMSLQRGDYYL